MNYVQILQDSFRLLTTNKFIWIFGVLSLLPTLPINWSSFTHTNPSLAFMYSPILWIIACISTSSLFYVIHQAYLNNKVPFSEIWLQGRYKTLHYIGIYILNIPLVFIGTFIIKIIAIKSPILFIIWLSVFLRDTFLVAFFVFAFSAVVINNINVLSAAWTSFRIIIYGNNFYRVFVITGFIYTTRLLLTGLVIVILGTGLFGNILPASLTLDYPTYQKLTATPIIAGVNWAFNLVFLPLETIMLIYVYLKFTNEVSYPALVQRQNTA